MQKMLLEKISLNQLFFLIFSFELGSAIVIGIASDAKQDAWIAVLMALAGGLILVTLYCSISKRYPGMNLYEIFELISNRKIAVFFSVLYTLYFFYISARVLRDFCELMKTAIFVVTPIEFIALIFMITISYIVYMGIETIGRTIEILSPYTFILMFFLIFFLYVNHSVKLQNLRPLLPQGWIPVIKVAFPEVLTFPFGEMVVFTVIMAGISKFKYLTSISTVSVLISGIALAYFAFLKAAVLTPTMVNISPFPLLSAIREISVAKFIERLDAIVVYMMMLGIFVKVCIFFLAGLKGLEYSFRLPYRYFVVPFAMLTSISSLWIAENFTEHLEEGIKFVPYYIHVPFQIVIPLCVWMFLKLKVKKGMQG
ncbi:endospore germination permease [Paenibacillus sp. GCM10027628]|uniref:GerAB/ArcD/ProY family transporter n=1 Tax=Paenibacillus sp. GCM10027628 TaxID=3273413 RepID=UPI0036440FEE